MVKIFDSCQKIKRSKDFTPCTVIRGIYTFLKNIKTTGTTGRNLKNIPTFAVVR